MLWCSVTGWKRYKKGFCQEIGISLFILGTCFHSYINVVEVRRSGIPASDPLHELYSSHIDFHPTLKRKKPAASGLRDIVGVMKGLECVGNVQDKNIKGKESLSKSMERFLGRHVRHLWESGNAVRAAKTKKHVEG